ncbi:hypothetical protein HK100_010540 [Physocladia obscura]|uniref:RRM domain-containing protein n=1 Tax=Physocladia obscura TaxID=109957 RepID=A0AAD5XIT5_9FUNG|nr:hypothetical protein HK100_010540 [Physocladia obscura]
MSTSFVPPSQTLYVRQVADKVSKIELKTSLYHLFSQHGAVIDVVVVKKPQMRNQAFIVFRDVAGATAAMRALQSFPFFERALKIEYAKAKSNAVALLEGKVAPPPRKSKTENSVNIVGESNVEENESDDQEESGSPQQKRARITADNDNEPNNAKKLAFNSANGHKNGNDRSKNDDDDDDDDDVDMEEDDDEEGEPEQNPPSNILFLNNLPAQVTSGGNETLTKLFKDYAGFKEVRLVPGKADLAFVEYKNAQQATEAKQRLDGFSLVAGKAMKIQYAKV